jgi:hypothetical protein
MPENTSVLAIDKLLLSRQIKPVGATHSRPVMGTVNKSNMGVKSVIEEANFRPSMVGKPDIVSIGSMYGSRSLGQVLIDPHLQFEATNAEAFTMDARATTTFTTTPKLYTSARPVIEHTRDVTTI